MSETLHCIYCGARLIAGATSCAECRSDVSAGRTTPVATGARCPRCKGRNVPGHLQMRAVSAECSVLECGSCGGVLVAPQAWGFIVEAAERGDGRFGDVGAPHGFPLSLTELLPLLVCPGCNRELDRVAFAGKSNISIDVCNAHGIWFDGGELGKVLDIVRFKKENGGALPGEKNSNDALTPEERREKVLKSMGIMDPRFDQHGAPIQIRGGGFSADRLAGRVALVAGGIEGAVAYGVLRAAANGAGSAFGWALKQSEQPADAVPLRPVSTGRAALPDLRCLFCGANHRESDDACGACLTPIVRITCTACGARIAAGEEKCRCGAPLLPDARREQMACPRCKSALELTELDANTSAHRCPRCLGSFFGIRDWTVVIDRTVQGRPLPLAGFVPLPPGREVPKATLDAGAACPRCRIAMERITFAMRSRVVVDICASHGMWLDAGELIALCAFMNQGRTQ